MVWHKQAVRKAIQIRIKINSIIFLNRDSGDISLNVLCTNLIKNELTTILTKQLTMPISLLLQGWLPKRQD